MPVLGGERGRETRLLELLEKKEGDLGEVDALALGEEDEMEERELREPPSAGRVTLWRTALKTNRWRVSESITEERRGMRDDIPLVNSESELAEDSADEVSLLGTSASGTPFVLEVVTNLFFAWRLFGELAQLENEKRARVPHFEQEHALQLHRTRQLLDLPLDLVYPFLH
jgi:hypothetical protein